MSEGGYEVNLMVILEAFSNNFSVEKVKKAGKYEEIMGLVKELEKVKFLLPSNEFLQVLRKNLFCGYCLENPIDVQSKCGHGFCVKCMEQAQSDFIDSKSKNVACLVCDHQLALLAPFQGYTECTQCGNFLHESFFYQDPLCHPICKMCVYTKTSGGSFTCTVCDKKLKFDLDSNYPCSLCCKNLSIFTSNFLCRSHAYCFNCYKAGLSEGRCFSCDSEIDSELKPELISLLSAKCSLCKNIKEKSLFINKKCCVKRICVACQVKVGIEKKFGVEKCMGCQSKLNLNSSLEI